MATDIAIVTPPVRMEAEELTVEFEVIHSSSPADSAKYVYDKAIDEDLAAIEQRLVEGQKIVDDLDVQIQRCTNQADFLDYTVAVASGLLCALVDSFWVGSFDFASGKAWSNKTVNNYVMRAAKAKGYDGKRLDGAIKFLEDKYKIPSDNVWKGVAGGISAKSHHLDDMAHHPSPVGLFFSILTQFTKTAHFQNKAGEFISIIVEDGELIGGTLATKVFAGTVNWFYHLVSDMSGSNKTAGAGMGIPGPLVSFLKEFASLPGIKNTKLPAKLHQVFVKEHFDLRAELAVAHELARQAVPVLINEAVVRTYYLFSRLLREWREKGSLDAVIWRSVLPWRNRTIVRMLTIASGTFMLGDLTDAAIRGAMQGPNFLPAFLLRVNFVGVGRFVIAVASDLGMGVKQGRLRDERIRAMDVNLHLLGAKTFYLEAQMWQQARRASIAIECMAYAEQQACEMFVESVSKSVDSVDRIGLLRDDVERMNPGLIGHLIEKMD
jgi:hypothetical protein